MTTEVIYDRFNRRALAVIAAGAGIMTGTAIARVGWLAAALVIGGCLVLAWPVQISLGLLAGSVPFDQVSALGSSGSGLTLTFVVGAMAMAVLVGFGFLNQRLTFPGPEVVRWTVFLLWALFTVWWAYDSAVSLGRVATMGSLFLLYLVTSCVRITEDEFRAVARFTILGGLVAALLAIHGFNGSARASLSILNRATDPNVFAAGLLLPLSLAFGEVISARRVYQQAMMAAVSGAILYAILLSMSRGALLAVVVIVAVYVKRLRWNWALAVGLVVAYCCLFFLPTAFLTRIQEAAASGGAGRLYIWQAGLAAFGQYWAIGAGLDNFPVVYQQFAGYGQRFAGLYRDAHNIYLQIGVELGLVGLVLFLRAAYCQFRRFRHACARYRIPPVRLIACEAASWGVLAAAFFLNLLWKKPFWMVFIMLSLGARLLVREAVAAAPAASAEKQVAWPQRQWEQLQSTRMNL
jgi:O-antigen ligase